MVHGFSFFPPQCNSCPGNVSLRYSAVVALSVALLTTCADTANRTVQGTSFAALTSRRRSVPLSCRTSRMTVVTVRRFTRLHRTRLRRRPKRHHGQPANHGFCAEDQFGSKSSFSPISFTNLTRR
jgi:hypothetical protein